MGVRQTKAQTPIGHILTMFDLHNQLLTVFASRSQGVRNRRVAVGEVSESSQAVRNTGLELSGTGSMGLGPCKR